MTNVGQRERLTPYGSVVLMTDAQTDAQAAMQKLSPQAGSFILVSTRRRKRGGGR